MKTNEFEHLSADALTARIEELKQVYFSTRAAVLSGKEKNAAQLKGLRRQVARATTLLTHQKKAASSLATK